MEDSLELELDQDNVQNEEDLPEDADVPKPVCSVLNTVVDFAMATPTAFEIQELRATEPVLVPVIRVFGPILRRDSNIEDGGICPPPNQSACLHIHGAFPYLLCRPRVAGADGSLTHAAAPHGQAVDWDSAAAVERILPILHDNLETAVQTQIMGGAEGDGNGDDSKAHSHNNNRKAYPAVRKLSVVMGRGFYTFCPGPPAPFIRVEYYDPKSRWRIKMLLERGLLLGQVYHPHPGQYDVADRTEQQQHPKTAEEAVASQPLQFHCYEAHIPYTMQFFKDYNLAGLSYIHVNNVNFRESLPSAVRPSFTIPPAAGSKKSASSSKHLFLSTNTPEEWRWPKQSDVDSAITDLVEPFSPDLRQASQGGFSASSEAVSPSPETMLRRPSPWILDSEGNEEKALHPPLSRETTCDVELDVHADSILNVHAVITDLSSTQAKETVHWRAVPSLQEVWTQERMRMSKLLPPKDDFLSPKNASTTTPPFTLNVKRDANLPGAQLAAKGMERLRGLTQDLESQYRRVLKQIVSRHAARISAADQILRTREINSKPIQLTPDEDAAMSALEMLGNAFSSETGETPQLSPPQSQATDDSSVEKTIVSSQEHDRTKNNVDLDMELMSQRVDRGDAIVDNSFQHVEDFIDPTTLAPYEVPDDDDDEEHDDGDEAGLERELGVLATQTFALADASAAVGDEVSEEGSYMKASASDEDSESADSKLSSTSLTPPVNNDLPAIFEKPPFLTKATTKNSAAWKHRLPSFVEQVVLPPRRSDLKQLATLKRLPSREANSTSCAGKSGPAAKKVRSWLPPVFAGGVDIEQTILPPSSGTLKARFVKKRGSTGVARPERNVKRSSQKEVVLQIDSNSRKHVPVQDHDSVEEVAWNSSQVQLSATQQSQTRDESQESFSQEKVLSSHSGDPLASSSATPDLSATDSITESNALSGIGNQGGRIWVEGGGQLKSKTRPSQGIHSDSRAESTESKAGEPSASNGLFLPTPVTVMVVEVHVQCRTGRAGLRDSKHIAMQPNSDRDPVFAVVYIFGRDPGGGDPLVVEERGCLFVPVEKEVADARQQGKGEKEIFQKLVNGLKKSVPQQAMGKTAPFYVGCVRGERELLLRIASVVYSKDPDMLLSWDTQGAGLGYLIERGKKIGEDAQVSDTENPGIDMARLLGRVRATDKILAKTRVSKDGKPSGEESSSWSGSGLGSDWDDRVGAGVAAASITGRVVHTAWKLVAEEVKHPNASYLQAVVSSVLGVRLPYHDNLRLTHWYSQENGRERWRVIHYGLSQATACLLLLDALDIIGRAGEAARLSGVEFSQSFPGIRGSQYKVEGVLLRALQSLNSEERGSKKGRNAKSSIGTSSTSLSNESASQTQSPWKMRRSGKSVEVPSLDLAARGYFFYSPSLSGTEKQEALEVQALTLEPQSGHQHDPVIVCDFTALYPSLVIAYNLCYSTVAGRLEYHSTRNEMRKEGQSTGKIGPFEYSERRTATVVSHHIKSLKGTPTKHDRAYVAPTGTIYVAESVLKGVLPQVLDELLSTRAMLKKAAKAYKARVPDLSPSVLRQLEARQLALKYVANVTYGYTSATFSGRCAMPLLADTIVECGRRTLHSAIDMVNRLGKEVDGRWEGCQVIYGDTDSLFIKLPGRSVQEAFLFGEEVCKAVTASNPPPVQLKLEKVYQGSIMQTKKKYCGMKYESKEQKSPVFEAKGLETIRRDQAPITQKILRNSLVTLFKSGPDAVKRYLFRQWAMLFSGNLPVSDFVLTGRVRSKYRGGRIGPVQAVLARRLAEADPGKAIKHKERLAYVIVATPGVTFRLKDCVLTPMELLEQWDAYSIHTGYYITKHVNAALQRCLGLAPHRIDVNAWYEECPKPRRRIHYWPLTRSGSSMMISSYFGSDRCSMCGDKCKASGRARAAVCQKCRKSSLVVVAAYERLGKVQEEALRVARKCSNCNRCYEDDSTFAVEKNEQQSTRRSHFQATQMRGGGIVTPLANCSCIDCPQTYERHRLRESGIEARAVCEALDLL